MSEDLKTRDRARAKAAIARKLCVTLFTDGDCLSLDDGDCRCNRFAEACVKAMESVGVETVWMFSPERRAAAGAAKEGAKG